MKEFNLDYLELFANVQKGHIETDVDSYGSLRVSVSKAIVDEDFIKTLLENGEIYEYIKDKMYEDINTEIKEEINENNLENRLYNMGLI